MICPFLTDSKEKVQCFSNCPFYELQGNKVCCPFLELSKKNYFYRFNNDEDITYKDLVYLDKLMKMN
ncbi:hypothetical protein [Clostridium sp. DL1XJH146]